MDATTSTSIAPGAHIELRDAIWRVRQVDPTSSGALAWRCVGVSEIVRDQEAIFLEEFEPGVRVLDPRETALVRDTSPRHRAGLLYMESLLRDVPPPDDGLYIGHRAAMDVMDFQLRPAWMALRRPRQRILIADGVGLGKTLEAGILLSELIRRGRARRILVATTKAMLTQFQKEMWARFSIPLVRLDSVGLQRIRTEIPTHHNPFYHFDRSIISIDTLKQNNWFRSHLENAHWDVIVIDEAHNVASRGSGRSRVERIRGDHRILELLIEKEDQANRNIGDPASLMNLYDVEAEERVTAEAIERGTSPEDFAARMAATLEDPFAALLRDAAVEPLDEVVPLRDPPSLFASDFDFVAASLERLQELEDLEATVDPPGRRIEIRWTDDLRRRFRKLPPPVRPPR